MTLQIDFQLMAFHWQALGADLYLAQINFARVEAVDRQLDLRQAFLAGKVLEAKNYRSRVCQRHFGSDYHHVRLISPKKRLVAALTGSARQPRLKFANWFHHRVPNPPIRFTVGPGAAPRIQLVNERKPVRKAGLDGRENIVPVIASAARIVLTPG